MNKKIIAIQDSPQQNQEIFLLPPRFFALNIVESTTPCNSADIEAMIKLLYPGIPNGNEHTRIMSQYEKYDDNNPTNGPNSPKKNSILCMLSTIYTWLKDSVAKGETRSESEKFIVPLIQDALSDIRCYPDHYSSLERVLFKISLSKTSDTNNELANWLMPKLWEYRDGFAGEITNKLIKLGGQKMNNQSTHTQNAVIKILDDEFGLYGKKATQDQFFDTTNLGLMRSVVIALAKEALQTKNVIKYLLEEVNKATIPHELIHEIGNLSKLTNEQMDDGLLEPENIPFKNYFTVEKEASSKIKLTEASVQVLLDNLINQHPTTENTVDPAIPIDSLPKEDALASQVLPLILDPNFKVTLDFLDKNNDALTGFLTQMAIPARTVLAARLSPDEMVEYCNRVTNTGTLCHTLVLVSENNPKTALEVMGKLGIKKLMEIPDLFHNLLKTTPDVFADLLKDPKNAKADVLNVLALTDPKGGSLAHYLAKHGPSVLQDILTKTNINSEDVFKVLALTDLKGGSLAHYLVKYNRPYLINILTKTNINSEDVFKVLTLTYKNFPLAHYLANHDPSVLQNILTRPDIKSGDVLKVLELTDSNGWSLGHTLAEHLPSVLQNILTRTDINFEEVFKVLTLTYQNFPLAHYLAKHGPSVLQDILTRTDINFEEVFKVLTLTDPLGGSLAHYLVKYPDQYLQNILTRTDINFEEVFKVLTFLDQNNRSFAHYLVEHHPSVLQDILTRPDIKSKNVLKVLALTYQGHPLAHYLEEHHPSVLQDILTRTDINFEEVFKVPTLTDPLGGSLAHYLEKYPDPYLQNILTRTDINFEEVFKVLALTYQGHPLAHYLANYDPSVLQNILTKTSINSEDVVKVLALKNSDGWSLAHILENFNTLSLENILTSQNVKSADVVEVLDLKDPKGCSLVTRMSTQNPTFLLNILTSANVQSIDLKELYKKYSATFWDINTEYPFDINSYKGNANPRYIYSILFPQATSMTLQKRSKLLNSIGEKDNLPAYFALNEHKPLSTKENHILLEKAVECERMGIFNVLISDQSNKKRLGELASVAIKNDKSVFIGRLIEKGLSVKYHNLVLACNHYALNSFSALLSHYSNDTKIPDRDALYLFLDSWKSSRRQTNEFTIETKLIKNFDIISGVIAHFSFHSSTKENNQQLINFFNQMIDEAPERFSPQCVSELANLFSSLNLNDKTILAKFSDTLLIKLINKGYACDGQAINSKETYRLIKSKYKSNDKSVKFTRSYWERIKKPFSRVAPIKASGAFPGITFSELTGDKNESKTDALY